MNVEIVLGGSPLKADVYSQMQCINYFMGPKSARAHLRVQAFQKTEAYQWVLEREKQNKN